MQVARSLVAVGMKPFQSVNVIGFNSKEWFLANLGSIFAGGKSAGIYTTNGPDACRYIVEHSNGAVVFTEDEKQTAKFLGFKDSLRDLKCIVQWTGVVKSSGIVPVLSWNEFIDRSSYTEHALQKEVDKRMKMISAGHCASLIYTSGTTGNPKAVMISHDNINIVCEEAATLIGWKSISPGERYTY